ncbi:hypothetical protein MRX96_014262 [Rhipicephalus microplus]
MGAFASRFFRGIVRPRIAEGTLSDSALLVFISSAIPERTSVTPANEPHDLRSPSMGGGKDETLCRIAACFCETRKKRGRVETVSHHAPTGKEVVVTKRARHHHGG